jgi:hypothetical protein
MLKKVISGGQTGIDRLGLQLARDHGIPTGGTAPYKFKTENGPDPSLMEFGLVESSSSNYAVRTMKNIQDSDGTVLFGNMHSPGSIMTRDGCKKYGKPSLTNPVTEELITWIKEMGIEVLNVAGNRATKLNHMYKELAIKTLSETFKSFTI